MRSDIEIAQSVETEPISLVAKKCSINDEYLVPYGSNKAKVRLNFLDGKELKVNSYWLPQ